MRVFLCFLLLVVALAGAKPKHKTPAPAQPPAPPQLSQDDNSDIPILVGDGEDCGSCDTLGYMCVAPGTALKDACGQHLDASHCPIPSCPAYCRAQFDSPNGTCDDATHLCTCEEVAQEPAEPVEPSIPTPPPPPPALPNCTTALTCNTFVSLGLQCIPPNSPDGCSGVFPQDACVDAGLPLCCNGAGTCSSDGLTCTCAQPPPPPVVHHHHHATPSPKAPAPNTTTTTTTTTTTSTTPTKKSPAKKPAHVSTTTTSTATTGSVHAATVPGPTQTTLNADGTVAFSYAVTWAVVGIAIFASVVVLAFGAVAAMRSANVIHARRPLRKDLARNSGALEARV